MNILFYTPVNFRCRDIESLGEKFISKGHRVFLLSLGVEGPLHESARQLGFDVTALTAPSGDSLMGIARRVTNLIKFCRRNKIQVCFSHLEPTNFISVLAQYFVSTKFILYRHHMETARLYGFDRSLTYRFTYSLAKKIVCVSRQAKAYMIKNENIDGNAIHHINLGYNFSLYAAPDPQNVKALRQKYPRGILLISAGRLVKYKRPGLGLELVKKLKDANVMCSIIYAGVGAEETALLAYAREHSIEDRVSFLGYTHNILDYLAASDLLVHPSVDESSCVVVKEAALVGLPVIVCEGVGDFDDYMENRRNGIVLTKENFVEEAVMAVSEYARDPESFRQMATRLRGEIESRFNINNVIGKYNELIEG
jgi:glycosyltransferase involved in cell wall biosynthesis